jgi:hypothetical protein
MKAKRCYDSVAVTLVLSSRQAALFLLQQTVNEKSCTEVQLFHNTIGKNQFFD